MKRINITFLIGIFFLSACAETAPLPPTATVSITNSLTSTPSPTATATQTPFPSSTPTATITSLPTMPTFTPTFDVSTIVTATPAPKAQCPKEDPSVVAKFATPSSYGPHRYIADDVLDYLNAGGTVAQLRDAGFLEVKDLTGDGVNEVVIRGSVGIGYIILGCNDGKYQDLLDFAGDSGAGLAGILDLNKNGVPEVILYNLVHYGYMAISVFELDGNKFRSLIDVRRDPYPDEVTDWIDATDFPKLVDIDGDGQKEIVSVFDDNQLCGGLGNFCDGMPTRVHTTILAWNGQNYVVKQTYYSPAQYRFQAVQDGDTASFQKEYDKALSLYQAAIFSDKLKSYSPEIHENLQAQYDAQYGTTPTPTAYPVALDEYPKLAAYAYFRIVLLHLAQHHELEATTVYNTLQKKFSSDQYGHPYAEIASAFWEAYQSTHKMYDGCAAAIHYAAEHPEILTPLGSDYHGSQSHIYVPADVCPFR